MHLASPHYLLSLEGEQWQATCQGGRDQPSELPQGSGTESSCSPGTRKTIISLSRDISITRMVDPH